MSLFLYLLNLSASASMFNFRGGTSDGVRGVENFLPHRGTQTHLLAVCINVAVCIDLRKQLNYHRCTLKQDGPR